MAAGEFDDLLPEADFAQITVQINLRSRELVGDTAVAGYPASPFHGWLELLRTLDRELQTLDQRRPAATRTINQQPDAAKG